MFIPIHDLPPRQSSPDCLGSNRGLCCACHVLYCTWLPRNLSQSASAHLHFVSLSYVRGWRKRDRHHYGSHQCVSLTAASACLKSSHCHQLCGFFLCPYYVFEPYIKEGTHLLTSTAQHFLFLFIGCPVQYIFGHVVRWGEKKQTKRKKM